MYITPSKGRRVYTRGGEQRCRRGPYLILMHRDSVFTEASCLTCFGFTRYVRGTSVEDAYVDTCYSCGGTGTRKVLVNRKGMSAVVRMVALHQLGHFMCGYARIFGVKVFVEGSYGSNGLPVTVSDELFARGVPVPDYLYDAWNHGGGHNAAGGEAQSMVEWAQSNMELLSGRGGKANHRGRDA